MSVCLIILLFHHTLLYIILISVATRIFIFPFFFFFFFLFAVYVKFFSQCPLFLLGILYIHITGVCCVIGV